MEFVSSLLSSILSKIGEYLVDSSIHQANYLLRFKNYVDDLKREDENLRSTQHRVQHDVERAKGNTEEIEKDVEKWLMDVQNVLEEIQRLEDDMQVKKTFLCGQCPNWRWRYKLSKRAVKKTSVMLKLRESGKFDRVSHSTTLPDANEGFVKMHDLVRDVALWITSKGENVFMVKAGMRLKEWPKHQGLEQCTAISLMGNDLEVLPDGLVCPKLKILLLEGNNVEVSDEFFEEMKTLKVASLRWVDLSVKSLQFLTNLVTLELIKCRVSDISSIKKLAQVDILSLKGSEIVELPEELGELNKLRMLDITDCRKLKRIPANVIPRLSRLEELYSGSYNCFKAWEVEGTSVEQSNASLSELSKLYCLTILSLCINVQPLLPKDFVLPTKLLRYCITVNYELGAVSYPKSRILKIRGIEATSLVAFKALREKSGVEFLELREIKGCSQNIVPSIDETGLNELKRLSLGSLDELECIIDTTQQKDVAFSNLVDLSLEYVGLREICSGGRPPRGFLENLETLKISGCHSMSCIFPSWVLIQRLRKLKKVTVEGCDELEDVFQLEGLSYAKENPFLLSSLESLHLLWLHNLRYIWKGPTQQVSLQSLTVVQVLECHKLRYLFTLSLARSLLQLEQLWVEKCDSLKHIVEIKEAEENVDGGGGNDVMFPKLRELQLKGLENFINFYSENSSVNMQTAREQLRDVNLLRHGLQNLEELMIDECGVQVLFQLEGVEQELSFPSLKVLELHYLVELECLCKGPTHLISLPNLKKLEVYGCHRLRHMFSPSLTRNLLQLELEYIFSIEAEENVGGGGGNDVMLPKLRILKLSKLENFISFFDSENYSSTWPALQELILYLPLNSTTSFVDKLEANMLQTSKEKLPVLDVGIESDQLCDSVLAQLIHGFQNLEKLKIRECRLSQLELSLPSLKELELYSLEELECLCKGPTHLLSLPNLKKLKVDNCNRLRHMFSSSLARNLLQLEELIISWCGELEQIFNEDDAEECNQTLSKDHFQWPLLFPNLKRLTVENCYRLRHMFSPSLARNLLQLEELSIYYCGELEQIFNEDDVADMTNDRKMVLPQLHKLTLKQLTSLINFCPVGYHFIFPSLSSLEVTKCPKLTTRFSVDQNKSVHAEAKAPQTGKEDADMEQSPPETTREIYCREWELDSLQKRLPPYIGK
ncbi:hypothetical protein LWI29_011736 [Acer saccharum]|uniref:Disease resistance protein At4g27190-like leucine-rich repeats domain-containing protein n=1 Tax=Acer saccharum TaxID=4024 RepID=A0AA39T1S0_ACESA|nr:hypothetical protein LWI29_011736 [Acer saccharum]